MALVDLRVSCQKVAPLHCLFVCDPTFGLLHHVHDAAFLAA